LNNTTTIFVMAGLATLAAGGLAGCSSHTIEVKPIKVEPIHMTLDVNIRVDRELDEFFDFEQEYDATIPATAPTAEPAVAPPAVPATTLPATTPTESPATLPGSAGGVR